MSHLVSDLNKVIFERLQLVAEFTERSVDLEGALESIRYGVSKARSLRGHALPVIISADSCELEPQVGVELEGDSFSLIDLTNECDLLEDDHTELRQRKSKKEGNDDDCFKPDEEKKKRVPSFRPFGVLEPQPAKQARRDANCALSMCCQLATLRAQICRLDEEILSIRDRLSSEQPDELTAIMEMLKV